MGCFAPVLALKVTLHRAVNPMVMRPIRQKQWSMAATTYWVMWLCACQTVSSCSSVSLASIVRKELDCVKCAPIPVKKEKKNRMAHPFG